jgi:aquaporin rerated protein, other eukaryote
VGVYYIGGSPNPARSFGSYVVTLVFDRGHWIYCKYFITSILEASLGLHIEVGPIIGSLIAVFFHKFIKMLKYEMANPGQDGDDKSDLTKNSRKRAEMIQAREGRVK